MPTSHIPARVAADAREADATLASLVAVTAPTDAPAEPAPAPTPAEPAPAPAPAAAVPPAPSVQPVPADDMRQRVAQLEQALRTTQGRLADQTEANARLQGRLDQLAVAPPAAPASAPTPAPAPSLISDKDREEYGDDLISLIGRVLQQTLGTSLSDATSKLAAFEGRLQRLEGGVQTVRQQTAEQRYAAFEDELGRLLPEWVQINEDPALLDWLENRDTLSGKKYGELLASAHEAMDAARVVSIFRLYKTGTPASAPPSAGPQPEAPAQPAPHIDPMTLAAPDTSPAAPAPTAPPAGKVWTQAEVDKLYDDKQKKRITLAQFQLLEADYFKAMAEGRVVAAA